MVGTVESPEPPPPQQPQRVYSDDEQEISGGGSRMINGSQNALDSDGNQVRTRTSFRQKIKNRIKRRSQRQSGSEYHNGFQGGQGFSETEEEYQNIPDMQLQSDTDAGTDSEEPPKPKIMDKEAHQNALTTHPFFVLELLVKDGRDLVLKDPQGFLNPYIKIKLGAKPLNTTSVAKKTVNPEWTERFHLPIEDVFQLLTLKVYSKALATQGEWLGSADIDLTEFPFNTETDFKLMLCGKTNDYIGHINVTANLHPKTETEKDEFFKQFSSKKDQVVCENPKKKQQLWHGVCNVTLVTARDIMIMDDGGTSDPYVKIRLGPEKYKSKVKMRTLKPKWHEQYDFYMYDERSNSLEITMWDYDAAGKDDFMGSAVVDLTKLEREKSHDLWLPLGENNGELRAIITITATAGPTETAADLSTYVEDPADKAATIKRFSLANTGKNINDVGRLQLKVLKAVGLASADLGGKSDPFAVVEIVNNRIQTHTEYKTLAPEWNKIYWLNAKDIHSLVEVTVYDEDKDKKIEFLGKVAVPLLRIRNGEKRWYQLKDRKLEKRAKGAILLEMEFIFNHIRAVARTFNPAEEKIIQPEPKFRLGILKRNINRLTVMGMQAAEGAEMAQKILDWESYPKSIGAFIGALIGVITFEIWQIPFGLFCLFCIMGIVAKAVNALKEKLPEDYEESADEADEEPQPPTAKDKKKKAPADDEKKGFAEKIRQIQETCLQVQEGLELAASMGERFKNTANWTVPWLSAVATLIFAVGTLVLYFVPLRLLIFAFVCHKFTKKLRKPNAIPNNELLDFISRVPSDRELKMYRELRPDPDLISRKKRVT